MKILLKGARIIDPQNKFNQILDILIFQDKIIKIRKDLEEEAKVFNLQGKIIIPGLIDAHTHLREPGREDKETILNASKAAAKGGLTAICAMPNTNPPIDDVSGVEFYKNKSRNIPLKIYPIGCISKGRKGEELTEMAKLKASGVIAFSDDGEPLKNPELMRRALEYSKMLDLPLISHCEEKNLTLDGVMHEGYYSTLLGLRGMPAVSEEIMLMRDLLLTQMTKGKIHIAHLSAQKGVEMLKWAKEKKINLTSEVTIQHLLLEDQALTSFDTNLKVNPPLRSFNDRKALIKGLKEGLIDIIVSDHAPHTYEEKEVEFALAPFGISGLDTLVPLVFSELVNKKVLTLERAIEVLAIKPAEILKLPKREIKINAQANLTILDLNKEEIINKDNFLSLGKNTPFNGLKLKGIPVMTIVEGKVVMQDGKVIFN